MSATRRCPLHRGLLIRTLYETNPFLKKCSLEGGVRHKEDSLWFQEKTSQLDKSSSDNGYKFLISNEKVTTRCPAEKSWKIVSNDISYQND